MALALVGEVPVGAAVGDLLRTVLNLKEKPTKFRPTLESLQLKLETLSPVIEAIEYQNNALGRPRGEIERLIKGLEDSQNLIGKCSKVPRWNYIKQMRYQKLLVESDEWLTRFLTVDIQALMVGDVKEILLTVRKVRTRLDVDLNHPGRADVTVGVRGSQIGGTTVECSKPFVSNVLVGLQLLTSLGVREEQNRGLQLLTSLGVREEQNRGLQLLTSQGVQEEPDRDRRKRKVELLKCERQHQDQKANEAQEAKEEIEAKNWDQRITSKKSIQREKMVTCGGIECLNSTLSPSGFATSEFQIKSCHCGRKAALRNPDGERNSRSYYYCEEYNCGFFEYYVPMENETSAAGEVANNRNSSGSHNEEKVGVKAREADKRLKLPLNSSSGGLAALEFQNKFCHCGRKAALRNPDSKSNSSYYCCKEYNCAYFEHCGPMDNERSAGREAASHGDSVYLDNEQKVNNEFEEMSRKCESLMQRLHELQGTNGGVWLNYFRELERESDF